MDTVVCVRSGTDGMHASLHHDFAPVHREEGMDRSMHLMAGSLPPPDATVGGSVLSAMRGDTAEGVSDSMQRTSCSMSC